MRTLLTAEPEFDVVGEAADGYGALQLAIQLDPDIILLDINMPGISGIELTRQLKEKLPSLCVLILTVYEDEELLRESIRAGAAGYIVKRAAASELIDAIKAVGRGDMYIHSVMVRPLLRELLPSPPASESTPHEPLTPRESEVLRLLAQGFTNRQIAEKLHLSIRTVESHRENVMDKLNLASRADLVRYAKEHGFFV